MVHLQSILCMHVYLLYLGLVLMCIWISIWVSHPQGALKRKLLKKKKNPHRWRNAKMSFSLLSYGHEKYMFIEKAEVAALPHMCLLLLFCLFIMAADLVVTSWLVISYVMTCLV